MADLVRLMEQWLDIIARGAFDEWAGTAADDIVFRLPYAPPGTFEELRGAELAKERLRPFWSELEYFHWTDVTIRRTEDSNLVVTTANSKVRTKSGIPYANSYVMLTRFRDGKVVEYVEYANPLKVFEAFGSLEHA